MDARKYGCLASIIAFGGVMMLAAYFTGSCSRSASHILVEPKYDPVNLRRWQELHVGMTKPQVQQLLGQPAGKLIYPPSPNHRYGYANFWEYSCTRMIRQDPFANEAASRAYVVYFDTNNIVTSWREPLTGDHPF